MEDDLTPLVLWKALREEFGLRSSVLLLGWCAVFGATGGSTQKEMRDRLMAAGLPRSSVHDASAKIQRLRDRLHRRGYDVAPAALVEKLNRVGVPVEELAFDFSESSEQSETVV